jgi:hypothetical protein
LLPNSTKRAKDFEKNPAPRKFDFREYILQKYGNPKSRLSLEPKENFFAGNDVSGDAQLLRVITPSPAGIT